MSKFIETKTLKTLFLNILFVSNIKFMLLYKVNKIKLIEI